MRKLIAANWKENPRNGDRALALFRATAEAARRAGKGVEVAVCPPSIYLSAMIAVRRRMKNRCVALGAQDVFWEEKGPYTSEVGPHMLHSLGVRYVIVGHSERRRFEKESDAAVNRKIKKALADGLEVILCVGESIAVRRKGWASAKKFVESQLKKDLARVSAASARRVIVAYEPIWAIGSGRSDSPADASAMAEAIKRFFDMRFHAPPRVLYGGSVNGRNARDYVRSKAIDGALVGGASLKPEEFKKILTTV